MKSCMFFSVLLLLMSFSCKTQISIEQKPRQIIQLNTAIDDSNANTFTIRSASIDGNTLTLLIETKGSSNLHEFDLLWDGSWMKSLPPKVVLVPVHKTTDKKQNKLVVVKAQFLLDSIAARGYDRVVIIIKGYTEQLMWEKQQQ